MTVDLHNPALKDLSMVVEAHKVILCSTSHLFMLLFEVKSPTDICDASIVCMLNTVKDCRSHQIQQLQNTSLRLFFNTPVLADAIFKTQVQTWTPAELRRQLMKEFQDDHLDLGALFHLSPTSGCCTLIVSVRRTFTHRFSFTVEKSTLASQLSQNAILDGTAMWSGLFTHLTESWNNFKGLDPDYVTQMDLMGKHGYRTQKFAKLDYTSGHHSVSVEMVSCDCLHLPELRTIGGFWLQYKGHHLGNAKLNNSP
ncbi:hypothetical protein llap_8190 [Limosa lapponica baueri]|uniref:Uncharacterized protein n=1 Tax=Limosa lapponica baueri TaxID=1758121 RepID=A0A2I0U669_LIMLA|nr:hypothetical protein llap_8190 [Limosa lapponica baueri]